RMVPMIDSTTGNVKMQTVTIRGRQVQDTVFHKIPDFSLTDENGKPANLSLVKGKIHIADFIFTRCPGQCPKMSKEMQRLQEKFEKNPQVVFLSYTVDPEHDTPEVLKKYAQNLEADSNRWHFLTGAKKDIYHLALKGYFITAKEEETNSQALEDRFVHTDKFVLVDTEGQIRGFYSGVSQLEMEKLVLETKILLHELENKL
ncbi:MAG: SCO family protein, partial [Verrucomicrobia bacterium]|nr:SCO family protein [Cytophagales bacterium]